MSHQPATSNETPIISEPVPTRRHRRVAALLAATTLTGCINERAATHVPNDLIGTWIEVTGTTREQGAIDDTARSGFLAIAQDQVVMNLTSAPRAVAKPVDSALAAGSGRLGLDNGQRLYLAGGRGEHIANAGAERVAVPCDYLDVDVYAVEGGSERLVARTRLWSQAGLQIAAQYALAARLASARQPTMHASMLPVDRAFIDSFITSTGETSAFASAAQELVRRAAQGDLEAMESACAHATRDWRLGTLALLDRARQATPGEAAELVGQAARRGRQLSVFRSAVARWRSERG